MVNHSRFMSANSLQSHLLSKTCFGFDLDDTLHEFRKSSTEASNSVFEFLNKQYGVDIESLRSSYQRILRTATANSFTDGRTSIDYRRERFTRLLQAHGLDNSLWSDSEENLVEHLLGIYKCTLQSSLTLKVDALLLLQTLHRFGKKIILITEGPTDAQEWTVRQLGLWPYIDVIVTTNEVGRSKANGLFDLVLKKHGITANDVVYFGDNELRDVQAAQRTGILAVLYDEDRESQLEDLAMLRIKSWGALLRILKEE